MPPEPTSKPDTTCDSYLPLVDIAGLVAPYLNPCERAVLSCVSVHLRDAHICGNVPPPQLQPLHQRVARRRATGFGRPSPQSRSVTNDVISGYLVVHHIWRWLQPRQRRVLAFEVDKSGVIAEYARLRAMIPWQPLQALSLPRTAEPLASMPTKSRSELLGATLIALDCQVGNLIRCLGPEFSHDLRNVDDEMQFLEDLHLPAPPPGQPPVDLPMAKEILQQGVPLQGHFDCPLAATQQRIRYDNHPPLRAAEPDVREKFLKEEKKCFHLLLPRCLAWFVFGLFISPISWILRKNKGRIVIDSSTPLAPDDNSSPNSQIPAPSNHNHRENPPVHYASAWTRMLVHIYKLRANWPLEEILMHIDDIEAAFRRAIYHPDLAAVFASVFMEFLVIPIGMIFGSRSSPSYFCVLSELRSHVASVAKLDDIPVPEEWQVSLPPDLTPSERAQLTQVAPDPKYKQPTSKPTDGPLVQAAFVDDNGKAELRRRILEAVRNSVAAAFLVFGFPGNDWRGACFAIDKWLSEAFHEVVYLGFVINSRSMTVSWPIEKRQNLTQVIRDVLPSSPKDRRKRRPIDFARILGHTRNPAAIAPSLAYISLRIQLWFNEVVRKNAKQASKKFWWRLDKLQVPQFVWHDLQLLHDVADSEDPDDPFWKRPIGLLIPRTTTNFAYQDASYEGLGGFSEQFGFSWRLHRDELLAAGIPMPPAPADGSSTIQLPFPPTCHQLAASDLFEADDRERRAAEAAGTHINVLEFVAAIINYYFILWKAKHLDEPLGGWIVSIQGDNTSALSWMRHAARAKTKVVQSLSRLFVRLPILFDFQGKITGAHIAGAKNTIADHLSRPISEAPSWAIVMERHPVLQQFPAFQVPPELLSLISMIMSDHTPEAQLEAAMTKLMTVEPVTLEIGSPATQPPPISSSS